MRGVKVLIVDDDPELRAVLRDYLASHGAEILEGANGLECLWQVKHERPDAILLDLNMPRLGGVEALKRIHKFDPTIRVIVLTASIDRAEHEQAMRYGAVDVYPKPYDLEELRVALMTPAARRVTAAG